MGYRIAIIGAASIGVSVFGNVVHSKAPAVDSITLIDPRQPGCGPVFTDENPLLLCNTSAGIGSLLPHKPEDFLDYLATRGQPTAATAYVPRHVVGEYVRARFGEYADAAAGRGIKVTYHPARARSIQRHPAGGHEVYLENESPQQFDRVVVCVGTGGTKIADGFVPHVGHPRLVRSPYPSRHLHRRLSGQASRVLVLGTGLSAIDAALLLCQDGHHVTMASRSGVLPAVRDRFVPPPVALPSLARIAQLAPGEPLLDWKVARIVVEAVRAIAPVPLRRQLSSVADPVRRLREEVGLVAAGQCTWPDIVVPLVDQVRAWAAGLAPAVQASLLSPYRPIMWRYITAMALENAQRLLGHIDAGRLRVAAYDRDEVVAYQAGFDVGIRHSGWERFDYVVNAAGFQPPRLYVDADTVYLQHPPTSATVLQHLDEDLRVHLSQTAPPEDIWLVGHSTHVRAPLANYLAGSVAQASLVAHQMSAR